VPQVPDGLTRSQLLGAGARGGAALLLAGTGAGALATAADARPPSAPFGVLSTADLAYVRLLIGVELLLVDFYTEAIASRHLHRRALADARLTLINETEHYNYLAAAITAGGGTPLTAADVDFTYPSGAFYTARSVGGLAVSLELMALEAYLGTAGNVAAPTLQAAIAQITANEAQHLAAVSLLNGQPAFHEAFPDAMTMEEASNALDAYTS
jgi:hypothetical protein